MPIQEAYEGAPEVFGRSPPLLVLGFRKVPVFAIDKSIDYDILYTTIYFSIKALNIVFKLNTFSMFFNRI